MASKFQHKLLLPTEKNGEIRYNPEGWKVASQIHDYMDMHNNKYGYIITHNELTVFRRRASPTQEWGQVDFSSPIPLKAERGQLNAMMVLWYFHVKYAVMNEDGGWYLPSYYHNYPTTLRKKESSAKNVMEAFVHSLSRWAKSIR